MIIIIIVIIIIIITMQCQIASGGLRGLHSKR